MRSRKSRIGRDRRVWIMIRSRKSCSWRRRRRRSKNRRRGEERQGARGRGTDGGGRKEEEGERRTGREYAHLKTNVNTHARTYTHLRKGSLQPFQF